MIQVYFIIMGIGCLLYYGMIRYYTGKWDSTFAGFWLLSGMIHLSGLLFWKWIPGIVQKVVLVMLLVLWMLFLITEGVILWKMKQKPERNAEYLIVLGAHVNGKKITNSLMYRLDAAYTYLCENSKTQVIVSGGQGNGEAISEAEAMAENLLQRGIAAERIVQENKSTTTAENLRFSGELISVRKPNGLKVASVVLVTNNFHICRALLIGRQVGYMNLSGLAAISNPVLQLNYLVREFFAVIWNYLLIKTKKIS